MSVHHGGKVGKAAKNLASNSTSKATKSKAAETIHLKYLCILKMQMHS